MSRPHTKAIALTALLFCGLLQNAERALPQDPVKQEPFSETHAAMGTTYEIVLYADTAAAAHSELQSAWDEIDRVDDLLSNYKPASELSRVSREASQGLVITDEETFRFIKTAIEWSRRTGGAFDMTVGRLMRTWGFFQNAGAVPREAALAAARREVGWKHVLLDESHSTVTFIGSKGMELDPGGIGKGYAVDRVVTILRTEGVKSALISAGSSTIYALGAPQGKRGWNVSIPDPKKQGKVLEDVMLRDTSLSTSACNEKFFVEKNHHYCHIMDPHTLRPVEGMLQTTVVCGSATESDVLSTALFVLGAKGSESLLAELPEVSALVVSGEAKSPVATRLRWPPAATL